MQADISRTGQRAEQDVAREIQRLDFTTKSRQADREDEKLLLAQLTQKTNEDLKREELGILSDAQFNKLKIARLERNRKTIENDRKYDIKLARLDVEIGKLEQSIGEAQAKILNNREFKALIASGDFRCS